MTVPGREVLDAFGLAGSPVRLAGGEGRSVRVADAVLKPTGPDVEFAEWLADVLAALPEDGFRVGRPLRARTGLWTYAGWTASRFVPGAEPDHVAAPRWLDIIAAGRAFHRALADVPRPAFLDRRDDWWALGDRVAWQEGEADLLPGLRGPYEELVALSGPVPRGRAQLVHGDLTGNVLFAPGLAPAVIDFSPYWRPPGFGAAVVVGDALIWHGAGAELLRAAAPGFGSGFVGHVARAVTFRLVTASEQLRALPHGANRLDQAVRADEATGGSGADEAAGGSATATEIRRYRRAVELLAAFR
ncbi:aminoglycoside phosphotransferase [Streptomyces flavofungini]|uniref:Aminoglycoside phosphotransferase n=1 Tax=Streptomyces flavofungini TaxID=68200 RepID=A0ABS0X7A9_9ACTN|nr:aminoglycoside phosphotransferase [Streptomyces flavofungini]MBJ3809102.1 aminoglycoside phosphotransferase [Streptomyces flavofungini]GHC68545.1 TIGR02569 family protein [Streptomyces flavofungini]